MYMSDLSLYEHHLPFPLKDVRCVGWLDSDHEYKKGPPPSGLVEKLKLLAFHCSPTFDVHVNVMRGSHPCNFCGRDVEIVSDGGQRTDLGASQLWFPQGSGWLAAPSLIIHYIEEHKYESPEVFVRSIFALRTDDHFLGQEVYDRLVRARMEGYKGLF